MNRGVQVILVFAILVGALFFAPSKASAYIGGCAYQLTYIDDFDGSALDTSRWNPEYPSGNGGEQQYYTPQAITLQDGKLIFTAEKRSMHGYPYTSGIITTRGIFSQQYGLFILRAKLPKGKGFWPAFWMLPAKPDYPKEIDIFELLGGDASTIYMSNHWRNADGVHQKNLVPFQGPDFSTEFHTFSLSWEPRRMIWYVDGVEQYRTSEGVPDVPMYLLVNFAVGGKWPGYPDETTIFPGIMQIDYIRVYQTQCTSYRALISHPRIAVHLVGNYESANSGKHYYQ